MCQGPPLAISQAMVEAASPKAPDCLSRMINRALGSNLRFTTSVELERSPDCVHRFWFHVILHAHATDMFHHADALYRGLACGERERAGIQ